MTIPSNETKADSAVPKDVPISKSKNGKRNSWIAGFTIFLIIIGIVVFLLWDMYFRFYESTDDAFANGNMIRINSAVNGSVVAFFADDTDLVKEGQLLVSLDKTYYQVQYEKEINNLAATILQVSQLYETIKSNTANRDSKKIKLEKARFDFNNRSQLVDSLSISKEDFIHSRDDLNIAEFELKQAESQLQMAQDAVKNTRLENHPLVEQQKSKVREAYYNLQHCSIYAPSTGYVAQRTVDVGQRVQPTTPLMSVIPADYVWVDANFKETQLTNMRVGQPATVTFDMYGSDVVFEGKVLGIASGSGSVFSLIPPQNATGNWIKIVQRLPVRISLDPAKVAKYPIRLGVSAYVDVDIHNVDLPMLVQETSKKPISKTNVFDIDFTEVNEMIDRIVSGYK
jgi:membrane fusion protein (multidrug efflux system)